jgi:hypothetical protein
MRFDFKSIPRKNWILVCFFIGYSFVPYLITFVYPQYFGFVILAYMVGVAPAAVTSAMAVPFALFFMFDFIRNSTRRKTLSIRLIQCASMFRQGLESLRALR